MSRIGQNVAMQPSYGWASWTAAIAADERAQARRQGGSVLDMLNPVGCETSESEETDSVGPTPPIISLAAGQHHTCALLAEDRVRCWGDNNSWQLGDGTIAHNRPLPVAVTGLSGPIVQLAAGGDQTCARLDTQEVQCWGMHKEKKTVAGLGGPVAQVTLGLEFACVLLTNGEVNCWGNHVVPGDTPNFPTAITGFEGIVTRMAAGAYHVCVVLDSGKVQCWGDNLFGQLGNGSNENRSSPAMVEGLDGSVAQLIAGGFHTCVALDAGEVLCWGANNSGQMGDATGKHQSLPATVMGWSGPVIRLAAGWHHTCGLIGSGEVQCVGENAAGQLGDGTTEDRHAPTTVVGLSGAVTHLSAGGYHTCAALEKGGAECWGNNLQGQLGDGTYDNKLTPTPVKFQ